MAETEAVLEQRRANNRAHAARWMALQLTRGEPWMAFTLRHVKAERQAVAVVVLKCGCVVEAVAAQHHMNESLHRSARACKAGHASRLVEAVGTVYR